MSVDFSLIQLSALPSGVMYSDTWQNKQGFAFTNTLLKEAYRFCEGNSETYTSIHELECQADLVARAINAGLQAQIIVSEDVKPIHGTKYPITEDMKIVSQCHSHRIDQYTKFDIVN